MPSRIRIPSLLVVLYALLNTSCQHKTVFDTEGPYPISDAIYFAKQFPDYTPNIETRKKSLAEAKQLAQLGQRSNGLWQTEGPGNIGARINCIAVSPSDTAVIFIGYADGGLWRTMDSGQNWQSVFDDQTELAIGSITFHPNDANTVFVGTGDPNIGGYSQIGNGIFVSHDLGDSWQLTGFNKLGIISAIKMDYQQPNTIYAASMGNVFTKNDEKGVYKSTDGGNTWQNTLFINDSTGVSDLVMHPTNPAILYAITWNRIRNNKKSLVAGPDAGVYKTVNGGETWEKLGGGLPEGYFSRLGIDIASSNPDVLYTVYTSGSDYNVRHLFKTNDGGTTWTEMDISESTGFNASIFGGFGWYFGKIKVNPLNENDISLLGVDLYRCNVETNTWRIGAPEWFLYDVHADKHDLIFDASGTQAYLATDGGLYKAANDENWAWRDAENIATTQFYRTAYNLHFPDLYYGGAQDNGTCSGNAAVMNEWPRLFGGDGFQMAFHELDPNIYFYETQNGGISYTTNDGMSWEDGTVGLDNNRNWDMPYMFSQNEPNTLYAGTERMYINEAFPVNWRAISPILTDNSNDFLRHQITTVHESPLNPNMLYCGTSDALVWGTTDKGDTWQKLSLTLPQRYVTSVKASPSFEQTVYVTFSGYRDNDFSPKIFKSSNAGQSWESIGSNLPNLAINDVFILPGYNDKVIFVATDGGVYVTTNGGNAWERLGDNMPYVASYDLDFNPQNNRLIAATFGRSIMTFDLAQLTIVATDPAASSEKFTVYPTVATQILTIEQEKPQLTAIEIYNLEGRKVYFSKFNTKSVEINVANYTNGMYLLKLGDKNVYKFYKR